MKKWISVLMITTITLFMLGACAQTEAQQNTDYEAQRRWLLIF